jgi:hypothetical protein
MGWCHQCSKGFEWMIPSIVSADTRGSPVPSTTALTLRKPATLSSTAENGKSVRVGVGLQPRRAAGAHAPDLLLVQSGEMLVVPDVDVAVYDHAG